MELEHRNVSVVNPAPDVNAVLCFVHLDLTWPERICHWSMLALLHCETRLWTWKEYV